MLNIIKLLYRWKIRLMFYFVLGWNELSTPIAVVRDIAVILTFAKFVFNVSFGWKIDALICLFSFCVLIITGLILKKTGMSDYATRLNNSINPEIKEILEIVKEYGKRD